MAKSCTVLLLLAITLVPARAQGEKQLPQRFDRTRHMAVAQVQPGMVGFGRTVYHGTKIETFDVEVVSVESGFQPGKQVVWVRCTDERMQKLGPVSGMSGSPIYLWPKGADPRRADPEDARMIGAFAFGFGLGKDCYAGIQPIEQMLAVGERAQLDPQAKREVVDAGGSGRSLQAAVAAAKAGGFDEKDAWRLHALLKALRIEPDAPKRRERRGMAARSTLSVPLWVGDEAHAKLLEPFFAPHGIRPMAGNAGAAAGLPPRWINPQSVELEPGGVLSVPLVTGDMDMPAVGTITEVLRDEQGNIDAVLGFGHAFMGQGATDMPLATGYVHFVQPSIQSSFKLGGTLRVVGALANDEFAAIAGSPKLKHTFRPATVEVQWPQQTKSHTYHYQLATDDYYTPILAAYVAALSIAADTELPPHASLKLQSDIRFDNGKSLRVDSILPETGSFAVMWEIMPLIAALTDTPFGKVTLDRIDTKVQIVEQVLAETITNATAKQTVVAPGQTVEVAIELTPFREQPRTITVDVELPEDLPEGPYAVQIGDANSFLSARFDTHPHLMRVTSQEELFEMVKMVSTIKTDALYITIVNPQKPQVAVGRTELPDLPSAKTAMLLQPTSTRATPYIATHEKIVPMQKVIRGQYAFQILVQRKPEAQP